MSSKLKTARNTAKELLAAAVLELFPLAHLIEGDVDEIGFYYDFFIPKSQVSLFSQKELEHIEDRIRLILHRKPVIKKLEMMRENAVLFLEHSKQPFRAERASVEEENIISLIEIDRFRNLVSGEFLTDIKDLKAVQLLEIQILSSERIRIWGTAFFDPKELKEFLKRYKQAKKRDWRQLGLKEGLFLFLEEKWVLLPKGEALLQKWVSFWREKHLEDKFSLIEYLLDEEPEHIHEEVLKRKKLKKVAAFQGFNGDLATIAFEKESELQEAVISSLHFMDKVFKIFGFETRAVCREAKPSLLSLALKKEGFEFEMHKVKGEKAVEFRAIDSLGREKPLSFLKIEEEKKVLHRSLFWSLENWVALYIEKGVDRV